MCKLGAGAAKQERRVTSSPMRSAPLVKSAQTKSVSKSVAATKVEKDIGTDVGNWEDF